MRKERMKNSLSTSFRQAQCSACAPAVGLGNFKKLELVKHWAERLIADSVDVILDLFDLKEGQDKFAFMERMVTDPSVTHVLVICSWLSAIKNIQKKWTHVKPV